MAPFLSLKDRTRCRSIISTEWSSTWEDYDVTYTKNLNGMTYVLQIIKCDSCGHWRGYHDVNHQECAVCCRLLCFACARSFYRVGMCNDCYQ